MHISQCVGTNMNYGIMPRQMRSIEVSVCPGCGTTELRHAESGKTAHISAWQQPNQQELVYRGTKLLREVERDREERARRTYFWLGAEAHNG